MPKAKAKVIKKKATGVTQKKIERIDDDHVKITYSDKSTQILFT